MQPFCVNLFIRSQFSCTTLSFQSWLVKWFDCEDDDEDYNNDQDVNDNEDDDDNNDEDDNDDEDDNINDDDEDEQSWIVIAIDYSDSSVVLLQCGAAIDMW